MLMKIATKITIGFGVLIVLMLAVLAYQLLMLDRLMTINKDLSQVNSPAALTALELLRVLDMVEENTQKYLLLGDPGYHARLMEYRDEFAANLRKMDAVGRSQVEREEVEKLKRMWDRYGAAMMRYELSKSQRAYEELPAGLSENLKQLRLQGEKVSHATQRAMESAVQSSVRTSQWADVVSWGAAGAALVISFLVSFFVVRSISEPLNRLTAGTRAITAGRFSFRLDASRSDEFAQLATDFNHMAERLNELDQLKKDFVSHISHELKTPLASMRECTNLLLSEIPGPLTDKQRKFLHLGKRSGERLSEMLSNLLDLSRMEAGVMQYELKPRDLPALVRSAIEEFEPQAQEKGLRLKAEVPGAPMIVECDGDRILQVFRNLLGNALKFSPQASEIVVRFWWEPRVPGGAPDPYAAQLSDEDFAAGFAVLSVADSGPGIPPNDADRIFEKFHQLKGGTKSPGQGAGLGLAISRTIVQAHRGAIWVEPNTGGGSIFYVALPVGSAEGAGKRRISTPV